MSCTSNSFDRLGVGSCLCADQQKNRSTYSGPAEDEELDAATSTRGSFEDHLQIEFLALRPITIGRTSKTDPGAVI